jgi:hypothetical protein
MIPLRSHRLAAVAALAALIIAIAPGCAREARPATPTADPAPLVLLPVDALEADLSLRQHVTARYGEREDGFDAVLQKRQGELMLVGLGPMSTVAFTLALTADGLDFDNRTGREVPFQPEYIVADVQRVFYPWLPPSECDTCAREGEAMGFDIAERFEGGRLIERRFRLRDAPERGEVVVSYEGWGESAIAPARVVLKNGFYGYELVIDTL